MEIFWVIKATVLAYDMPNQCTLFLFDLDALGIWDTHGMYGDTLMDIGISALECPIVLLFNSNNSIPMLICQQNLRS